MLFLCVKKSSQGKDAWFSLSLLEDVSFPFFPLNFTCLMTPFSTLPLVSDFPVDFLVFNNFSLHLVTTWLYKSFVAEFSFLHVLFL